MHLVAALHREDVGTVEGLTVEGQAELRQPRGKTTASGELRHDDPPRLPPDRLRGHDLVRPRVLEHAVLVDARRVRECVRADDGLVRLHRDPSELAHEAARRHEPLGLHGRVRAVVIGAGAERHDRLLQRRVAATLAEPVHRDVRLVHARIDSGERVRDREAEVVVAVHRERDTLERAERRTHREHERGELLRLRVPDGVGDVHRTCAGRRCGLVGGVQEVDVGARGVLGRELDLVGKLGRACDGRGDARQAVGPRDAELALEMTIARRDEHMDARAKRTRERLRGCFDVGPVGTGERGHRRPANLTRDACDSLGLADRRRGEARLEDVDAEVGEGLRDEEFRLRRERRAGRLLAVAERGVEDRDLSHRPAPTGSRGFAGADCCGTSRRGSHGIISRSRRPTCSIGCVCSSARRS